jgi:hypothetical protein
MIPVLIQKVQWLYRKLVSSLRWICVELIQHLPVSHSQVHHPYILKVEEDEGLLQFFNLFLDEALVGSIADETNKHADQS